MGAARRVRVSRSLQRSNSVVTKNRTQELHARREVSTHFYRSDDGTAILPVGRRERTGRPAGHHHVNLFRRRELRNHGVGVRRRLLEPEILGGPGARRDQPSSVKVLACPGSTTSVDAVRVAFRMAEGRHGISPGRPPPMSISSSLSAADGGVGAKAGSEDAERRVESEGVRSGPLTRMRAPRSA